MRALPPQMRHDPVETGPYRMAMGLTVVPDRAWFEIDALYPAELAEKHRLLRDCRADVFAAQPGSEAAWAEALDVVTANLTTHNPDWFSREGSVLRSHLTGESWNLDAPERDPLELAGLLVQEDLCLIQNGPDGPIFTAGILCFPSRWRLREKIGRPLAEVHAPVPLYADRLSHPVDRFMQNLRPGRVAARLNWSVVDDPALFQPDGKWRHEQNAAVTAENAGDTLFLRVERQTLRLLPVSGAILFGIRVHVYPLRQWVNGPDSAGRLAAAVRALPEAIARYKSLPPIRPALLAWLDRVAG
jgi:hypothetical protein